MRARAVATPTARAAEQAVLAALMSDPKSHDLVLSSIELEDFHHDDHQALFDLIVSSLKEGRSVTVANLTERIARMKMADRFGGLDYPMRIEADFGYSSSSLKAQIRDVREAASQRRLLEVSELILENIEHGDTFTEVLQKATDGLEAAAARSSSASEPENLGRVGKRVLERFEGAWSGEQPAALLSTDIESLDHALGGGFRPGDYVVIGARPAEGKTSLGVQIAERVTLDGHSVLVFSAEMSNERLFERILAYEAGVPTHKMRNPSELREDEQQRIREAVEKIDEGRTRMRTCDAAAPTLEFIRGACKRHATVHGLDLVMLDYFQILGFGQSRNEVSAMNAMSKGLLGIAKELNCVVVLLAQLNRDVGKMAKTRAPRISDIKGCGQVEQDAHFIIFPTRPWTTDKSADPEAATLHVAKARDLRPGEVPVRFVGEFTRFEDVDDMGLGESVADLHQHRERQGGLGRSGRL
jgi:replicative DNA helicase